MTNDIKWHIEMIYTFLNLSANIPPTRENKIHGKNEIPYRVAIWNGDPVFSNTSKGRANFLSQSPKLDTRNVSHNIL